MSDPQALHAALEEIAEDCLGSAPLMALHDAVRAVLELHKPVQLGSGRMAFEGTGDYECAGCRVKSVAFVWADKCSTVKVISSALGVTTDG